MTNNKFFILQIKVVKIYMVIKMIMNLKKLRQNAGLSQQQLANIIMVSQQSINKYENHNVEPDTGTLIKIADFFDVSLDYLIGRTDIKEMVSKPHMSDLSEYEARLVKQFRCLNEKQQACVMNIIDSYR